MKKMLLVDGNSLLFRAYHATNFINLMRTSTGVPTNAIVGFANMINKALDLIQPDYIMVAFDASKKTFRHDLYKEYKGTRKESDEELKIQFAIVREYLDAHNILWYEQLGIEADDIIGTLSNKYKDMEVKILSSDKDLLQLINDTTSVMLMKKGMSLIEEMNPITLKESMGITPKQVIDLKSLMGDTADNIPGIKGIGEKTALELISNYDSLEGVYENINELKGKRKEKIELGKEDAYMSKQLATIKIDCDIDLEIEDFKLNTNIDVLNEFFLKYEMKSLIKKSEGIKKKEFTFNVVKTINKLNNNLIVLFDYDNENYQDATLYGIQILDNNDIYYINIEDILNDKYLLNYLETNQTMITYDAKTIYHICNRYNININKFKIDLMIASFVEDSGLTSYDKVLDKYNLNNNINKIDVYGKKGKPKFVLDDERYELAKITHENLFEINNIIINKLKDKNMYDLFINIEMPLIYVLYEMEKEGVLVDRSILETINKTTEDKINILEKKIHELANREFKVNSPKELGIVLFDELGLKSNKKKSTAQDILENLVNDHPIISYILEYRKYSKLNSTYALGLQKYIASDNRIHTIFNQCSTQTGRLSSSEPNLQNISVRDEESREIRKAFIAGSDKVFVAADYSQIELRILAHMANVEHMKESFNNNEDIHTSTAMKIFNISKDKVNSMHRRHAKAVNFGIVYGLSEFGLSEQLGITPSEASEFINKYFELYPEIKIFNNDLIDFVSSNSYVTTMFNRRREIPEINNSNYNIRQFAKRAATNAPIQGTSADIIKIAMINIYNRLNKEQLDAKLILQIHDELIIEAKQEEQEIVSKLLVEEMENAYKLDVKLKVNLSIGSNWYEAK